MTIAVPSRPEPGEEVLFPDHDSGENAVPFYCRGAPQHSLSAVRLARRKHVCSHSSDACRSAEPLSGLFKQSPGAQAGLELLLLLPLTLLIQMYFCVFGDLDIGPYAVLWVLLTLPSTHFLPLAFNTPARWHP